MPTYEYACRDCGEHLEVVQSFSDEALTRCPACQGSLRKVFSAAGLIFKGSGWHIKDYASSSRSGNGAGSDDTADRGKAKPAEKTASGSGESASGDTSSKDTASAGSKTSGAKTSGGSDTGQSKKSA